MRDTKESPFGFHQKSSAEAPGRQHVDSRNVCVIEQEVLYSPRFGALNHQNLSVGGVAGIAVVTRKADSLAICRSRITY
jgi:hypothetical protein